ncbi:MAG: YicC/YloC family endoribonuclease [Desulfovibrio sp.]|uniref:YicC/YloC family endoribonuclease n=1 Tax=Desulfovibrio sp. 7SRBS1 TaxID=3378064 RepID=UPI003B3EB501
MIKSMTGFGRAEANGGDWAVAWEVKSVNSRFLDTKWRTPAFLRSLEASWEKVVRRFASRGRVDLFLNVQINSADMVGLTFNRTMAASMLDQMASFADDRSLAYAPDLNRLLNMSMLWQDVGGDPDPNLAGDIAKALEQALTAWDTSRMQEGKATLDDLQARLATLEGYLAKIEEQIPLIREEKLAQLKERVKSMLDAMGAEYSEDRMLQETVILTDRIDVSEELTRLGAHLKRIGKVLAKGGESGKRLDFLIQETFREINTCGNKAQNSDISAIVVDFKTELEKCREQVQNLE